MFCIFRQVRVHFYYLFLELKRFISFDTAFELRQNVTGAIFYVVHETQEVVELFNQQFLFQN